MSNKLKRDNAMRAAKAQYDAKLEAMSEQGLAQEIDELERYSPKTGSFAAWQLRAAIAELDNRL